jgi:hypothetical protein
MSDNHDVTSSHNELEILSPLAGDKKQQVKSKTRYLSFEKDVFHQPRFLVICRILEDMDL